MSKPEFFATPGYGDTQLANLHYSQAVRIDNRVEISGQGGWDDNFAFPEALEDEIVRAFDNVARTLAEAGATWRDVVSVDSFHVVDSSDFDWNDHNRVMVEQFRKRMGDRAPIWTEVGVAALGAPGMRIEIRVAAILG
ncbi:Rid family hydrolase [Micromonospora sp. DH14]|uniref:Rid family hydrolase n=1 Tax=Micromonospora sp. DH14 TaxID=3040120 RepID=UPI0024415003|nr:Rid family hydrolase [Micromonospora sp. DH14]MDG9673719.1 Rid family hydrolase [Micromonospora sp. DH14]